MGFEPAGPVISDTPGTLAPNVSTSGRNIVFASVLSDPDGIQSVGRASVQASDGQVAVIAFTRQDTNTFVHAASRRNVRWRSGTMTVTYTDNKGNQTTLTENWSVT